MLPWHQYLLGVLFIIAGANHFRTPKIYERIMPPYFPQPQFLVLISGIAEMLAGLILLNSDTQSIGAWGIIAMLVVFFTVHLYMLQDEKAAMKLPKLVLILRLPLQFGLLYWAYQYI